MKLKKTLDQNISLVKHPIAKAAEGAVAYGPNAGIAAALDFC